MLVKESKLKKEEKQQNRKEICKNLIDLKKTSWIQILTKINQTFLLHQTRLILLILMVIDKIQNIKVYTPSKRTLKRMMMILKHQSCFKGFQKIQQVSVNKFLVRESKKLTKNHIKRM